MKKLLLTGVVSALSAVAVHAQETPAATPPPPQAAPRPVYVYDQKPLPGMQPLIAPDFAQSIIDRFRTNIGEATHPRIAIFVNHDLVDEQSGMKLSSRTEHVDTTRVDKADAAAGGTTTTHSVVSSQYQNGGKAAPTLADRQTVRDVERLMGRPLRAAGATIVDQRVAAQLIGERPLNSLGTETEQARKDREAITKIADVALEVLVSSRNITVVELGGDKVYPVPDIQVTAIQLKDSKVLGQASAADVMNRAGGTALAARNYSPQDITEVTALALMDDILHGESAGK
jgi:hypothetical protein